MLQRWEGLTSRAGTVNRTLRKDTMPINLARIDDRLIHGQVITTWVKNHDIEQILIINDKVAGDSVQQSVITMSAPPVL